MSYFQILISMIPAGAVARADLFVVPATSLPAPEYSERRPVSAERA